MYDAEYALLRRAVKILLTPPEETGVSAVGSLPATYDRISRACRGVVAEAGKGEGLYDIVKMELERCVGQVERLLASDEHRSIEWLVPFTQKCEWFEKQVVSACPIYHLAAVMSTVHG